MKEVANVSVGQICPVGGRVNQSERVGRRFAVTLALVRVCSCVWRTNYNWKTMTIKPIGEL